MTGITIELVPDRIIDVPESTDFKSRMERLDENIALAVKIGLPGVVNSERCARKALLAEHWSEGNGLEPLSDDELKLWREYLPSSYWSNFRHHRDGDTIASFENYCFHEGAPPRVCKRIEETLPIFSVLEIRTPEERPHTWARTLTDPVLFGHAVWAADRRKIYRLARWGKDADASFLPSIDDIRVILKRRRGFGRIFRFA